MVSFRPLASSSAGCAYLLSAEGVAGLLIDCGLSYVKLQVALDFRLSQVCGCLISHAHKDHCEAWEKLAKNAVPCFASGQTADALKKGIFAPRVLLPRKAARIGTWSVTPFEAVHDVAGTFGFVIDGHGARLLYLTDSAYCPLRFDGLTHICIEANHSAELMRQSVRAGAIPTVAYSRISGSHMSIERLVQMLKANDLSKVQEIHLLHLSDGNSDARDFRDQVQKATGCATYIAPKRN